MGDIAEAFENGVKNLAAGTAPGIGDKTDAAGVSLDSRTIRGYRGHCVGGCIVGPLVMSQSIWLSAAS